MILQPLFPVEPNGPFVLQRLEIELANELEAVSGKYLSIDDDPDDAVAESLRQILDTRNRIVGLMQPSVTILDDVQRSIGELREVVESSFSRHLWRNPTAQDVLGRCLHHLGQAHRDLQCLSPYSVAVAKAVSIEVPSSLLHQARHAVFPAERMAIACGFDDGDLIRVTTLFDITGVASAAHVRSNRDRFAGALMAMEKLGGCFAFWIHSHPGRGALATMPSPTDWNQYAKFRQYYADLLAAIVTEDGCLRFWGNAVEQGRLRLTVTGPAIHQDHHDEYLYHLE